MTLILSYYTIKALLYCYFFLIIAAAVPPTTNQIKATPQILPVGEKPFPAHAPPLYVKVFRTIHAVYEGCGRKNIN